MAHSTLLFPTQLYRARLAPPPDLAETCLGIAAEDRAGRRWARTHGYGGYTSYASLNDLPARATVFARLEQALARHARQFARALQFDMAGRKLVLDSLWVNVMKKGGRHDAHIHPHAVLSGTYYVRVPPGAGAVRFEDPRLAMMMAAPQPKPTAALQNRRFVAVMPGTGLLLLWESWLRHGVEENRTTTPRISISFNYRLD